MTGDLHPNLCQSINPASFSHEDETVRDELCTLFWTISTAGNFSLRSVQKATSSVLKKTMSLFEQEI